MIHTKIPVMHDNKCISKKMHKSRDISLRNNDIMSNIFNPSPVERTNSNYGWDFTQRHMEHSFVTKKSNYTTLLFNDPLKKKGSCTRVNLFS